MKFFPVLLIVLILASFKDANTFITVSTKKASSGNSYAVIYQNKCKMVFSNKRPDKNDKSIHLCIAAAFTQLENNKIDGVYMINGEVGNANAVSKRLGGATRIMNGNVTIFPTKKGKLLTKEYLDKLSKQKGSLFQQIQIISNGNAASFVDKAIFQRRAIVIFNDGKTAIVESQIHMTLAQFSKDLLELGAKNAIYTDMGGWDEGWYRDPATKEIKTIGLMKTSTAKQSNWISFRE